MNSLIRHIVITVGIPSSYSLRDLGVHTAKYTVLNSQESRLQLSLLVVAVVVPECECMCMCVK